MNLDKILTHCRVELGNSDSVSDQDIEDAIAIFARNCTEQEKLYVRQCLLSLYNISVKEYQKLTDSNNPGANWLLSVNGKKNDIEWPFWDRYSEYLTTAEHYSPGVIFQLDKLTDDILNNLFDPTLIDHEISKKGLVVGQVQSGKTSNFTGLICKAVDSGFNVIIVFAGILDDLRTQTQTRLEKCFLGFSTKDYHDINITGEKIGVGCINTSLIAHAATTISSDFKETTVNANGINFQTKEPLLFVVKKNTHILDNLRSWLSSKDRQFKSVLFIDDEADNASVNTSKQKEAASTINQKIKDILKLFKRNAYVGYTATPYANIFIDPTKEDDLFPRHFIINIPTPPAYIGPERVFGLSDEDERELPLVNVATDYKCFVPDRHKKADINTLSYENFPQSLDLAIRCFIISCAIRISRGQGNKHNSMLIHLSRFQMWQNQIKNLVERKFDYYKNEIMADDPSTMESLRSDFESDKNDFVGLENNQYKSYRTITEDLLSRGESVTLITQGITMPTWEDVQKNLYAVVSKIEVKALNGSSSDTLAYEEHKEDGYYVIAVGGDKLSRGLTLEGLTVSYFLRASKMYDTLMQMGRWFGYRTGYVDVCRLFVSSEIKKWFKCVTIANHELREEFDYMSKIKASPQQYALKVRTSPGLLVTSPLKMQSTDEVQISWASTLVESYSLLRSRKARNNNFDATTRFLMKLKNQVDTSVKDFVWKDVPCQDVITFLKDFELPESTNIKMNKDLMVQYIENCLSQYSELRNWRVVLRNVEEKKKNEEKSTYTFNLDNQTLTGGCTYRVRVPDDNSLYTLPNCRVIAGPKDEYIDVYALSEDKQSDGWWNKAMERTLALRAEEQKKNPKLKGWDKDYPSPVIVRKEFRSSNDPLLIIYPLNPTCANIYEESDKYRIDENQDYYVPNEDPFIGFAIVFPASRNQQGVKYKRNKITDFEECEADFELENDNQYE